MEGNSWGKKRCRFEDQFFMQLYITSCHTCQQSFFSFQNTLTRAIGWESFFKNFQNKGHTILFFQSRTILITDTMQYHKKSETTTNTTRWFIQIAYFDTNVGNRMDTNTSDTYPSNKVCHTRSIWWVDELGNHQKSFHWMPPRHVRSQHQRGPPAFSEHTWRQCVAPPDCSYIAHIGLQWETNKLILNSKTKCKCTNNCSIGHMLFYFCSVKIHIQQHRISSFQLHSLKLTYPLKKGLPKRKIVFQPLTFRGEHVGFREGIHQHALMRKIPPFPLESGSQLG